MKGVAGKFSNAVTLLMNEMAADGWDYIRSDTLPCEERQGLTGKTVKYHAMMMFRRAVEVEDQDEPLALPSPEEEIEVEDPVDTQDESTDEMSEQDDETETETKSD